MEENEKRLVDLVAEMDEDEALALARQMLDEGVDPLRVLELCREAMDIVGKRFEQLHKTSISGRPRQSLYRGLVDQHATDWIANRNRRMCNTRSNKVDLVH